MKPQTSLIFALSALAGLTHANEELEDRGILDNLVNDLINDTTDLLTNAVSSAACSTNRLATLMKNNAALAAPFCSSSVGVVIKTPIATVTSKPTR